MDGSDDYYSSEAINARAADRRQEDFNDLQNEMAGRENGKTPRFISDEERAKRSGKLTAAQKFQEQQMLLTIMLANPEYAALYNDTMSALNGAEMAVYEALVESSDKVDAAQKALEEAEKRGASEEELEQLREKHREAQERHQKMLEHEERLRQIRARMEDKDNPPTQEEMDGFQKEMDGIKSDANISIEIKQVLDTAPAQENTVTEKLDVSGFSPV